MYVIILVSYALPITSSLSSKTGVSTHKPASLQAKGPAISRVLHHMDTADKHKVLRTLEKINHLMKLAMIDPLNPGFCLFLMSANP